LNEPIRSISITVLKPFADSSSARTRTFPAAPQTSTSIGPSSARLRAKAVSSALTSRTSAATAQTRAPSARSSTAAASSFCCVRPQMATLAPSAPKFFAMPRLMPLPPPVTKTVLPLKASLAKKSVISMSRGLSPFSLRCR
jgi:hypothetical protein